MFEELEPLSYFFGAFLGDGYLSRNNRGNYIVGIECADKDIVIRCYLDITSYFSDLRKGRNYERITAHGTGMYQVRWNGEAFYDLILSAVGDKEYFPGYIWDASREAKLDLLAGLLDTDGHAVKNYGYIKLTGGKKFIEHVPVLCATLGIRINAICRKPGTIPCYDILFDTESMVKAGFSFYLKRKQERLDAFRKRNRL